jgi:IS30 family transposase
MSFIPEPRPHKNTPLTLEERKEIKKRLLRGYSCSVISKILERGKNSVVVEVRRNGGKDKYDPNKAHEDYLERKVQRDLKVSKLNKNNQFNPYHHLKEKVENLEMQVEILYDEIQRIRNEIKEH